MIAAANLDSHQPSENESCLIDAGDRILAQYEKQGMPSPFC